MQKELKASLVIGAFRYREKESQEAFVKAACALAAATAASKEWIRLNPHEPGTMPGNPHAPQLQSLMDNAIKAERKACDEKELHEFVVDRFISLTKAVAKDCIKQAEA